MFQLFKTTAWADMNNLNYLPGVISIVCSLATIALVIQQFNQHDVTLQEIKDGMARNLLDLSEEFRSVARLDKSSGEKESAMDQESVIEIARLRALVTKQGGMIGWLQSKLNSITNSPSGHVATEGGADLDKVTQGTNATSVIPLSMWGEDLTKTIEEETRKELINFVNTSYTAKQMRHPRGNDPNFVVSTLMTPEAWDGYDIENPKFMYDFEKRRWNIVYEANDGFESKRVLHIEANGRVWDSAISLKPFDEEAH